MSVLWKLHYGRTKVEAGCSQETVRTVLRNGSLERGLAGAGREEDEFGK